MPKTGLGRAEARSAVTLVDYEPGFGDLITRLGRVPTYPSLDAGVDVTLRMLRSTFYLLTATAHGMDYFPDFDRAPFVAATVKRLYESLPMQLYDRIAAALQGDDDNGHELVSEWTLETTLPIPPVTAIILSRSASVDQIPARLLEVREEFSGYRERFRRFKAELRAADTLKERRRLRRRYAQLLEAASGPDAEIVTAEEVLNLAEKTVKLAAAPRCRPRTRRSCSPSQPSGCDAGGCDGRSPCCSESTASFPGCRSIKS
jgi:hypothetical protein